jgi:carbonic anhydrase/acetyltransferase-like protein (isoleucine patch superfamily)
VAPGATVVGDVEIGARASVWFSTVVRGDTAPIRIGADSNVQDNTTVHVDEGQPAVIGARVTIGHRAVVHGCVIEDDCLIGMGAIVLSGARVGSGSLVGAGALVREGQSIPPGSLVVGAPARLVGPTTEAHRASIRHGAEHYVALSRSYLARGFARPHPFEKSDTGINARQSAPMSFMEWSQLVAVLAASPGWAAERFARRGAAAWRTAPGPARWSAADVICHLRDADADIFAPRLERLLAESAPEIEDVDMTGWDQARRYADDDPAAALAAWTAARRGLVARLAPLGRAEWSRFGFHSLRGPYPVSEMVRYAAEHDLSHRRQIAAAIGEPA